MNQGNNVFSCELKSHIILYISNTKTRTKIYIFLVANILDHLSKQGINMWNLYQEDIKKLNTFVC